MTELELGLIGNGSVGALIDGRGEVVWACLPRFDGDPVFCSLLRERDSEDSFGFLAVELTDFERAEQRYQPNTPVLVTRLHDRHGGTVEIIDFAPRFRQFGRMFCPMMMVRSVRPLAGSPRVRVRVRPAADYGRVRPQVTWGSNHIRYLGREVVLRLTTDCSITALTEHGWRRQFREPAVDSVGGCILSSGASSAVAPPAARSHWAAPTASAAARRTKDVQ